MSDLKVYLHIHGVFGSGKTTFGLTGPKPTLIADVEGAAMKAKAGGNKILWKDWDKTTDVDTVVYPIKTEQDLQDVINYLIIGDHPFNTFVLDSLTLYQTKLKRELQQPNQAFNPDAEFTFHAWNRVLNHMLMQCEDLLSLVTPDAHKPINVCLISATDREAHYMRPLLEGQIRKRLPGLVDIHGYMKMQRDKEGELRTLLHFEPTDLIDAKCRLWQVAEKHPKGYIVDPTIRNIIQDLNTREE
tara:strand:- start:5941 stop:6672 length:732 start_codon:yes stop_codon:yes gene_type:complete